MKKIADIITDIKVWVSLILLILVLMLLVSRYSWARISFGQLLAYPEIRFYRHPSRVARVGTEYLSEDIYTFENRGSKSASEVYLSVVVPTGRVTRYDFICQEPYTVSETLLPSGRLGISLERLGPRAKAALYVWSATGRETPSPVEISVTARDGTIESFAQPTATEEVESYVRFVERIGQEIVHLLRRLGLLQEL